MKKRLILLCSIFILAAGLAVPAHAAQEATLAAEVVSDKEFPLQSGDTFYVSVRAKDFTVDFATFSMYLTYNPTYMEVQSVELGALYAAAKNSISGTFWSARTDSWHNADGTVLRCELDFRCAENVISRSADDPVTYVDPNRELFRVYFKIKTAAPAAESIGCDIINAKLQAVLNGEYIQLNDGTRFNVTVNHARLSVQHVHVYSDTAERITEPTCTEDGEDRYYCVNGSCRTANDAKDNLEDTNDAEGKPYYRSETVKALGHDLTRTAAADPRCEDPGNIEYWTCGRCNLIFSSAEAKASDVISAENTVIAPTGHHPELVETVEPTCTEDGVIEHYRCPDCGKLFLEAAESGDNTIEVDGKYYTNISEEDLTDLSLNEENNLGAKGHTYNEAATVPPVCGQRGTINHFYCPVCESYFVPVLDEAGSPVTGEDSQPVLEEITEAELIERSEEALPALVHDYNSGEVTQEPTCTEKGVMTYTCRHCGDSYTKEIPMVDHTKPEDPALIITVEPTGKTDGYIAYACTVCGQEIKEVIPATGVEDETDGGGDGSRRAPATLDWADAPLWLCVFTFFAAAIGAAYAAKKRRHG